VTADQSSQHEHGDPEPGSEESRSVEALVAEIARLTAIETQLQTSLLELQRAEEVARRSTGDLADFLENAPVPIHRIDATGKLVWANRAELELLGYSADEYLEQPISAFHVDQAVLADMLARLARGETLHDYHAWLRAKDGTIRHVLVSSNMHVRDGQRISSRCFTRDITDRQRAEDERDKVIADLHRTVRLNEMVAGILGHDLRGPLSTIVMAGQLLLGYIDEPKGVRTIRRILSSADRMQQMIGQLLDFARARMDGGIELDCRVIDVSEIARDVIEEIRFARPDVKIEVEVRGDLRGDYDGNRLSQVFSNLVGNAAQHGAPDTPLRVRIDGRDPATIEVEIGNHGTIPPDLVPILFSPFRGSHQKASRSQGLGLGLFITEHIVRAHGGQITVRSGDGTTAFGLHLPRRATTRSPVATFDASEPASSSDAVPAPAEQLAEPAADTREPTPQERAQEIARRDEARFRLLVDGVTDYAIFMLDVDGYVVTWNAGAERCKGYKADEIIGRHVSVFDPDHGRGAGNTEHELAIALRDGRFEDEGWRVRKDGSRFWASVISTALRDPGGALIGYANVTQDLTLRRQREAERVQLAATQEAVRLRDELAAGRFELELEQADIAELVVAAVDRMREAAAAAGCTLRVTADHAIGAWDRPRVGQIISNLVSNAIRYAAGTLIEIAVTREASEAVIEVRDRGPGLEVGQLADLFECFERAAAMRHYAGLGLGLYVVRRIAEAHGGSATASNAAGGGACFTVRLPLSSAPDVTGTGARTARPGR
jgi:PAS domain S-box-containing protein